MCSQNYMYIPVHVVFIGLTNVYEVNRRLVDIVIIDMAMCVMLLLSMRPCI